jgi:NAD(P)-dependent dehydrogenase (short-subunit alcohol dehydrogenase family)
MELELKNKIVLVTGSSRGIGKEIASAFLDEGCKVILNGRDKKSLEKTSKFFNHLTKFIVADVTKPLECQKLVKKIIRLYGRLDILVCNVGDGKSVPPGKETSKEWQKMFELNLQSATNVIEASKKELSKTRGSIVCISSIAGLNVVGAPIPYSVIKSALNTYVKYSARPLGEKNIRINAIAPGNIMFKGSVWEKKKKQNPTLVNKILKNEVSLHRFGNPKEIANLAVFLSSPKSSFITGSVCVIDGGQIR